MENVGTLAIVVPAMLIVAGALLGGAIAHWRRGTGYIITGAIIGGAVMAIPAALIAVGTIYAPYIAAAAIIIIIVAMFFSFFN